MPERKVWTAEELLEMTPNERHATVQGGFVTDLDRVPEHLLGQAQHDIQSHITDVQADAFRR